MDSLLGEIRLFPFSWAPEGWAICDGALLPVRENEALFTLLGAKFGGDGKKTFALPDLRGRAIVGVANPSGPLPAGRTRFGFGQAEGAESVTLTIETMPAHAHATNVSDKEGVSPFPLPKGSLFAKVAKSGTNPVINIYAEDTGGLVTLNAATVAVSGGGQAHENMQPFLAVGYCICINGSYPPRQES